MRKVMGEEKKWEEKKAEKGGEATWKGGEEPFT